MTESEKEITKEEYDRLSAMTYGEVEREIESKLSPAIIYGYGYYGHRLHRREGKHYLVYKIGSSCD